MGRWSVAGLCSGFGSDVADELQALFVFPVVFGESGDVVFPADGFEFIDYFEDFFVASVEVAAQPVGEDEVLDGELFDFDAVECDGVVFRSFQRFGEDVFRLFDEVVAQVPGVRCIVDPCVQVGSVFDGGCECGEVFGHGGCGFLVVVFEEFAREGVGIRLRVPEEFGKEVVFEPFEAGGALSRVALGEDSFGFVVGEVADVGGEGVDVGEGLEAVGEVDVVAPDPEVVVDGRPSFDFAFEGDVAFAAGMGTFFGVVAVADADGAELDDDAGVGFRFGRGYVGGVVGEGVDGDVFSLKGVVEFVQEAHEESGAVAFFRNDAGAFRALAPASAVVL